MKTWIDLFSKLVQVPIDVASVALLRIVFGMLLL
ncbi:uncharacterized protein METZ01_LOCUS231943 [marine metagenome]|uniref:Uncharacterized protein n=1 Tax=marine metagenome TaxID=408172 RepID=A0A382GVU1_9ZZZZ